MCTVKCFILTKHRGRNSIIPFDQLKSTHNYYFRQFGNFGHSPKYYAPIFGVNFFAKIFSLQNFVSYSMYKTNSASWLIICVWLRNTHMLGQVGAYFNSSETWLVEISVITVTDANRTLYLYIKHS